MANSAAVRMYVFVLVLVLHERAAAGEHAGAVRVQTLVHHAHRVSLVWSAQRSATCGENVACGGAENSVKMLNRDYSSRAVRDISSDRTSPAQICGNCLVATLLAGSTV